MLKIVTLLTFILLLIAVVPSYSEELRPLDVSGTVTFKSWFSTFALPVGNETVSETTMLGGPEIEMQINNGFINIQYLLGGKEYEFESGLDSTEFKRTEFDLTAGLYATEDVALFTGWKLMKMETDDFTSGTKTGSGEILMRGAKVGARGKKSLGEESPFHVYGLFEFVWAKIERSNVNTESINGTTAIGGFQYTSEQDLFVQLGYRYQSWRDDAGEEWQFYGPTFNLGFAIK
ncbi:hypothetical protein ACFLZI_02185 [Nitrospirota bacterium]